MKSCKIEELVDLVKSEQLVLPEIQREFVWNLQKIADLWDSIYRGYPIGQLLFWETDKNIPAYSFFDHKLSDKNAADELVFVAKKPNWHHNKTVSSNDKIIVLDGQQRLTSLYLGLSEHGVKVQPQRNSRDHKIHIMKLGLFIGKQDGSKDENQEKEPLFAWKPIDKDGAIKDANYVSLPGALAGKKQSAQVQTLKARLRYKNEIKGAEIIPTIIPVMDLTGMDTADVLEVFQRLNNGGQKMSKSELFLAMWFGEDKANHLKKDVNELRKMFGDFVVKDDTITRILARVFGDKEKSDNLSKNEYSPDMFPRIQRGLGRLKIAVKDSIKFINDECHIYSDSEMLSHSLFVPIVYTFYINPKITDESKKYLRSFIYRSLIFGLFDRSTTTTLARLKDFVNKTSGDWSKLSEIHGDIQNNVFGEIFRDKLWLHNQINDLLQLKK